MSDRDKYGAGVLEMAKLMFSAGEIGRMISHDEALAIGAATYKMKSLAARVDYIREHIRAVTRK